MADVRTREPSRTFVAVALLVCLVGSGVRLVRTDDPWWVVAAACLGGFGLLVILRGILVGFLQGWREK